MSEDLTQMYHSAFIIYGRFTYKFHYKGIATSTQSIVIYSFKLIFIFFFINKYTLFFFFLPLILNLIDKCTFM